MEFTNKVGISNISNDKLDLDLTSNVNDQTIGACTSDVDLLIKSNTSTIISQTSCLITTDIEKTL